MTLHNQSIVNIHLEMISPVWFEECITVVSICKRSIARLSLLFCFRSNACTFGMKCCVDMLQVPGLAHPNILQFGAC